ncbi:MAG: 54S ribosomal protein L22, mitochondrial [Stictis urceolatum]|nr:54S ribosomal protein L22, mitochondrial [Stictis urceolata]
MSLHLPLRPLARSSRTLLHPHRQILIPLNPRRTLFNIFKKRTEGRQILDPLSEDFLTKKNHAKLPPQQTPGSLTSSIFDEDNQKPSPTSPTAPSDRTSIPLSQRDKALMTSALDPNPKARIRWERKMVIRNIQRRGRISKAVKLARTERQHLSKSPFFTTSVKKMVPLARQIAGKSVEDALVQMRFSKKRAARAVMKHLRLARDEAVVARGMGLGSVKAEDGGEGKEGEAERKVENVTFRDKKGKSRTVGDRSAMYIDQAWVGRGSYGSTPEFRARGRTNILKNPQTSISFLLKEEHTRIRQAKEREEKRAKRKPWVHHPDRPITAQKQYVLW